MSNNVVLVPGAEKRGSVIHTYVSVLFLIIFPIRLLQNTEQRNSYKGCQFMINAMNISQMG